MVGPVPASLPIRQASLRKRRHRKMIVVALSLLLSLLPATKCELPDINEPQRSLLQSDCQSTNQSAYLSVRISEFSPGFSANDAFRIFAAAIAQKGFSSDCAAVLKVSSCVPTPASGEKVGLEQRGSGCDFQQGTSCAPKQYYKQDIRVLSAICSGNCVEWPGLSFVFCAGNVPVDFATYQRTQKLFCANPCYLTQNYTETCLSSLQSQMNQCFDLRVKIGLTGTNTYSFLMDSVLAAISQVQTEQQSTFKMTLQSFSGGAGAYQRPFMIDVGRANSTTFWSSASSGKAEPAHFLHNSDPQLHTGDWNKCPATCGLSWQTRPSHCQAQPGLLDRQVNCINASQVQLYRICTSTSTCGAYQWQVSPWSPCSQSCNAGFATRKARCVDVNGTVVADDMCTGPKPPMTTQCNMGSCQTYRWLVGNWTSCSAKCGGGYSTRPLLCVNGENQAAPAAHCGPKPLNLTLCNIQSCGKCDNKDCSEHGQCRNGVCSCAAGWKGFNCEVPQACKTFVVDKHGTCCESGIVDADGLCHNGEGRLDASGTFCPVFKQLDACGKCEGPAQVVDNRGTCSAAAIDATGNPCPDGAVDECGVCGGLDNSCALVISVEVHASPRTNLANTAAFLRAMMPRILALAGVAPKDKASSNILATNRGWTLKDTGIVATVVDAVIYPPFLYATNASISIGSTQMRMAQMLPWSFPYDSRTVTIVSPVMVNRRGVCGNGVCEIGERPIEGKNPDSANGGNGTFFPTEPFVPCTVDCPVAYRPCPSMEKKVCSGNGYCTGNGVCSCFKGYSGPACHRCAVGWKFYGKQCVYDTPRQAAIHHILPAVLAKMRVNTTTPDITELLPELPRPGVHINRPRNHDLTSKPPTNQTLTAIVDRSNQAAAPAKKRPTGMHAFTHFVKKNYIVLTASVVGLLLLLLLLCMFVFRRRQVRGYAKGDRDAEPVKCLSQLRWRRKMQWTRTGKRPRKETGRKNINLMGPSPPLLEEHNRNGGHMSNLIVVIDSRKNIGPAASLTKAMEARDKLRKAEEEELLLSPHIPAVQQLVMEQCQRPIEATSHVLEPPVKSVATSSSTIFYSPNGDMSDALSSNSFTRLLQNTGSFISKQWETQQKFLALVRNPDGAAEYEQAQRETSWDNKIWRALMPDDAMDWREEAAAERELSEGSFAARLSELPEYAHEEGVEMARMEVHASTHEHEYSALLQQQVAPMNAASAAVDLPAIPPVCSEITPAEDSPPRHHRPRSYGKRRKSPEGSQHSSPAQSMDASQPLCPINMYRSPLETASSFNSKTPSREASMSGLSAGPSTSNAARVVEPEQLAALRQEAPQSQGSSPGEETRTGRLARSTQRLLNIGFRSRGASDTKYSNLPSISPIKPKPLPNEDGITPPQVPSTPSPPHTPTAPQTPTAPRSTTSSPAKSNISPFTSTPPSPLQDSVALGRQAAQRCSLSPTTSLSDLASHRSMSNPSSPTAAMLSSRSKGTPPHDSSPSILSRNHSSELIPGPNPNELLVRLHSDDVRHLHNIPHTLSDDGYGSQFDVNLSDEPIGDGPMMGSPAGSAMTNMSNASRDRASPARGANVSNGRLSPARSASPGARSVSSDKSTSAYPPVSAGRWLSPGRGVVTAAQLQVDVVQSSGEMDPSRSGQYMVAAGVLGSPVPVSMIESPHPASVMGNARFGRNVYEPAQARTPLPHETDKAFTPPPPGRPTHPSSPEDTVIIETPTPSHPASTRSALMATASANATVTPSSRTPNQVMSAARELLARISSPKSTQPASPFKSVPLSSSPSSSGISHVSSPDAGLFNPFHVPGAAYQSPNGSVLSSNQNGLSSNQIGPNSNQNGLNSNQNGLNSSQNGLNSSQNGLNLSQDVERSSVTQPSPGSSTHTDVTPTRLVVDVAHGGVPPTREEGSVNPFSPEGEGLFSGGSSGNPFNLEDLNATRSGSTPTLYAAYSADMQGLSNATSAGAGMVNSFLRDSTQRENGGDAAHPFSPEIHPPQHERREAADNPFVDVTNLDYNSPNPSPRNPFGQRNTTNVLADNATPSSPFVTNGGNPFLTSVEIQQRQLQQISQGVTAQQTATVTARQATAHQVQQATAGTAQQIPSRDLPPHPPRSSPFRDASPALSRGSPSQSPVPEVQVTPPRSSLSPATAPNSAEVTPSGYSATYSPAVQGSVSQLALMLDEVTHTQSFDVAVAAARERVLSRNAEGDELTVLVDSEVEGTPEKDEWADKPPTPSGRRTWQVPDGPVATPHHFSPPSSASASPQLDRSNPLWSHEQEASNSSTRQSTLTTGPLPEWVEHPEDQNDPQKHDPNEVTSSTSAPVTNTHTAKTTVSLAGWNNAPDREQTIHTIDADSAMASADSASSLTTAPPGAMYHEVGMDDVTSGTPVPHSLGPASTGQTMFYTPVPYSGYKSPGSISGMQAPSSAVSEATSGASLRPNLASPISSPPSRAPSQLYAGDERVEYQYGDSFQSDTVRYESSGEVQGGGMDRMELADATSRKENVSEAWQHVKQVAATEQLPPDQAFKIMAADLLNNMKTTSSGLERAGSTASELADILQVETSGFSATLPLPPSGQYQLTPDKYLNDMLNDDDQDLRVQTSIHSQSLQGIESLGNNEESKNNILTTQELLFQDSIKLPDKVKTIAPKSAAAALALARAARHGARPDRAKQRMAAEAKSLKMPAPKAFAPVERGTAIGAAPASRTSPLTAAKGLVKGVLGGKGKPDASPERMARPAGMLSVATKKSPAKDGPFRASPLTATNLKVSPMKTVANKLTGSTLTPQKDRVISAVSGNSTSKSSSVNKSPSRLFAPTQSFLNKMASPQ